MQVLEQQTVRLGHKVRLEISSPDGVFARTVEWTLASATDRTAGELGVRDTALGARLLGAYEGDDFIVHPDGGDEFGVTVLRILG